MKTVNKNLKRIIAAATALAAACGAAVAIPASYAEEAHRHVFSEVLEFDGRNHYRSAVCCEDLITDVRPHNYENGKCVSCGYELPAPVHEHSFKDDVWEYDGASHWRPSDCGHKIVADAAEHSFKDGVCADCGYALPEPGHRHEYSSEWEYDAVNHWRPSVCGHFIVKDVAPHAFSGAACECGYIKEVEAFEITASGYNEGLCAEWNGSLSEGVTVSYREKGSGEWTHADKELIREIDGGRIRADVVGLKAGEYSISVTCGGKTVTQSEITVFAHDRSGYAHFGAAEGVGAYKNDGTPKDGAQIIYVSEATKNTVKAKIGGKDCTGIVQILSALPKSDKPVIIRIIGTIGAAAWNAIDYGKSSVTADYVAANTPSTKGETLEMRKYTMTELIEKGFNTLDESVYTELDGLSDMSYMNYDSNKKEFDSCWNNCVIGSGNTDGKFAEHVTIEGVGSDAGIVQWGMTFRYAKSVEVRNLTFDDYTEDACSFEGNTNSTTFDGFDSSRIWLHNCTFYEGYNAWDVCNEQDKGDGDGSTDFKKLAYLTISYNHYIETHKTGLIGGGDDHMTAAVTFHHNYYQGCKSRLPLARAANMHMYNNYYQGTTSTCLSIRSGGYAFVEYCYFDNAKNPVETLLGTKAVEGKKRWGFVKIYNCEFKKISYTASEHVKETTDRTARFENDNIFSQYFDTDAAAFYYDEANARSDVAGLITDLNEIPVLIPRLAGVMK